MGDCRLPPRAGRRSWGYNQSYEAQGFCLGPAATSCPRFAGPLAGAFKDLGCTSSAVRRSPAARWMRWTLMPFGERVRRSPVGVVHRRRRVERGTRSSEGAAKSRTFPHWRVIAILSRAGAGPIVPARAKDPPSPVRDLGCSLPLMVRPPSGWTRGWRRRNYSSRCHSCRAPRRGHRTDRVEMPWM